MSLIESLQLYATFFFFPFLVSHTPSKHCLRLFWSLLFDFLCVILLYFFIIHMNLIQLKHVNFKFFVIEWILIFYGSEEKLCFLRKMIKRNNTFWNPKIVSEIYLIFREFVLFYHLFFLSFVNALIFLSFDLFLGKIKQKTK